MLLIKNITYIFGLSVGGEWYLSADEGRIVSFGSMSECPEVGDEAIIIDAGGGMVIPAFCDSHTHLVYAGSRDGEFRDKIAGLSYEEIAKRGGGILNSADRLHATSEDELFEQSMVRVRQIMAKGTGAVEIKSGYGLNTQDELKMLRVIKRIAAAAPELEVRTTFLGAHAVGRKFTGHQKEYVDLVVEEMIPAVAEENLADFVDVFCDKGFFTVDETRRILNAAAKFGIRPKIHANELDVSGGVQVGVECGAISVDHLERMGKEEINVLSTSTTIPTMLPGCSFFLGLPYAPARMAVDAGLPVALASDYNPGSSPSGDMRFVTALGCIKMRLTPEEAFLCTTLNGAKAMDLDSVAGSIAVGKNASFIVTRPMPSLAYIPYAYTEPWINCVVLKGKVIDSVM